jgi:hypothetical protein
MVQTETWRTIVNHADTFWKALGPLITGAIGLYFGARLSRSSDRKKWLSDHRAAECREVLEAMAMTIHFLFAAERNKELNKPAKEDEDRVNESYLKCLAILQHRIFIARDVKQLRIRERWVKIVTDYSVNRQHKPCQDAYEELQDVIVKIALGEPKNS